MPAPVDLTRAPLKTAFSRSTMTVSERAAARPLRPSGSGPKTRSARSSRPGWRCCGGTGAAGLTVAEVLAEAGLSTRAFYRHFRSKDELVLAVFEQEAQRRVRRARGAHRGRADSRAPRSRRGSTRRSRSGSSRGGRRRTKVLAAEGARLQADFPEEFAAILAGAVDPLDRAARARCRARIPSRDAWSIYAVTWELVEAKLRRRADRPGDGARPRVALLPARRSGCAVSVVNLPPVDSEYFDAEYETMPRPQLRSAAGGAAPRDAPARVRARAADPRDVGRRRACTRATSQSLADFREPRAVRRQGRGAPLPRRARRPVRRTLCALPPTS